MYTAYQGIYFSSHGGPPKRKPSNQPCLEDQSANALARLEDEVQAGTPADHPEPPGMRSQDSFGLLRKCRERERERERDMR